MPPGAAYPSPRPGLWGSSRLPDPGRLVHAGAQLLRRPGSCPHPRPGVDHLILPQVPSTQLLPHRSPSAPETQWPSPRDGTHPLLLSSHGP